MVNGLSSTVTLAVWLLTGIFFGMTASIYGAMRRVYRMGILGHILDWVWCTAAGILAFFVLVGTNWGVFRAWLVLAIVIGYMLWAVLAGPMVYRLFYFAFLCQARLVRWVVWAMASAAERLGGVSRSIGRRLPPPRMPRIRWRGKRSKK